MSNDALRRMINQCVRCGQCRSACPIFQEVHTESTVARGKLALLRMYLEGKDVPADELNMMLSKCLLCKTCTAQCPSGVKADELILAGREAMAQKQGFPLVKRAVFSLLKNRALFDLALTVASLGQDVGVKRLPGHRIGAIMRFPMPGMGRKRVIAPFADKSFRKQYPEIVKIAKPKARVAFFTGCMTNYIYTDAGKATVDVLAANQIEVVIPKMQHCCGFPVITYGDSETGRLMAKHNIEVFSELDVDAIVTVCGSCGSAWRHEYERIFAKEPVILEKVKKLAKKTYDIAEYLTEVQPLDKSNLGIVNTTVTIHDPCHLGRGLGVTKQVRKLLAAIPGVKIVEMKEPDRCCGSGGSFSMAYYDLSRDINERKISDIMQTEADVVIMGCGTCRMHIIDGVSQRGAGQNALHTVQLLAESYAAAKNGVKLAQ
jgi:glycolate oxidase iron-sulfur subunit